REDYAEERNKKLSMKAAIDFKQAKRLLSLLFQPDDYVTIAYKDPGQTKLYGARTEARDKALEYASELITGGKQVYFGVLPRLAGLEPFKSGKKDDIQSGKAVWVDIDGKHGALERLKEFSPLPSIIVDSGNGYHAYWLVTSSCQTGT